MLVAQFVWQLEHPREHRRHQLAVRNPVGLDQPQELFRIEPFHYDCSAAHTDREIDPDVWRCMIQWCGRQINQPFAEPPNLSQSVVNRQCLSGRLLR